MEDYFDIKRWLSNNEKVVYDTESNNLSVNKIKKNRGIITDRRTIFLGHGEKKIDLYHNSVISINYEHITYRISIIIGVVLSGIGIILAPAAGSSLNYPSAVPVFYFGLACLFIGITLIILFFRTRHFRLDVFSNDIKTRVIGPKEAIQKIREEISSKKGKPSEEEQKICNVCGTHIPGGKNVCPSCGDTYH